MALILHLTDLHLGKTPDSQDYGDYKSKIVAPAQRTTRRTQLENTLQSLATRVHEDGPLEAVVVSGDLTVRNNEEGFKLLQAVLGKLGQALPPPERILIVPGNHDVEWRTPASKEVRYAAFLKHVRKAGYVTPFLDGVDIDEGGGPRGEGRPPHHVYSPDGGFAIFAINSSNWCGSLEPITGEFDSGEHAYVKGDVVDLAEEGLWRVEKLGPLDEPFLAELTCVSFRVPPERKPTTDLLVRPRAPS